MTKSVNTTQANNVTASCASPTDILMSGACEGSQAQSFYDGLTLVVQNHAVNFNSTSQAAGWLCGANLTEISHCNVSGTINCGYVITAYAYCMISP